MPNRDRLPVSLVRPPSGHGGIARYSDELERRLEDSVAFARCRVSAMALRRIPLLRQLPLSLQGATTGPVHFAQLNGLGLLLFRRLPATVVTVHDLGFLAWPPERASVPLAAQLLLRLSFAAIPRADRVIAVSRATRDSLIRHVRVAPERIVVIPEGVEHSTFSPADGARRRVEERWGIGNWEDWQTIVSVGSELPRKNVGASLELIRLFRERRRRVRLIKVGAAGGARHRRRTLRVIESLGIRERVRLIDDPADTELADLYRAADMYLCASRVEGFSLPTLEALACGAPVAVHPTAALEELVGPAGLVLRGTQPSGWLDDIEELLSGGARTQALRERGPVRARAFDWDAMAAETLAVYQRLSRGAVTTRVTGEGASH